MYSQSPVARVSSSPAWMADASPAPSKRRLATERVAAGAAALTLVLGLASYIDSPSASTQWAVQTLPGVLAARHIVRVPSRHPAGSVPAHRLPPLGAHSNLGNVRPDLSEITAGATDAAAPWQHALLWATMMGTVAILATLVHLIKQRMEARTADFQRSVLYNYVREHGASVDPLPCP